MAEQFDVLQNLKELAEATDDSEWTTNNGHLEEGGQRAFGRKHKLDDDDVDGECEPSDVEEARAEADAAFIQAASPAMVLQLIAVVEAAKAHLDQWSDSGSRPSDVFDTSELETALAALEGEKEGGGR